jgi:hypothetical protein
MINCFLHYDEGHHLITAAVENKEITRNLSFFIMIGKPVLCDDEIDDILESRK